MSIVIDGSNGVDIGAGNLTFPDNTTQNSSPIGVGQTWQNVLASRALATTYTNNTGKPIMVNIVTTSTGSSGGIQLTISGVVLYGSNPATSTAGFPMNITALIPVGATYSVANTAQTLTAWNEVR